MRYILQVGNGRDFELSPALVDALREAVDDGIPLAIPGLGVFEVSMVSESIPAHSLVCYVSATVRRLGDIPQTRLVGGRAPEA